MKKYKYNIRKCTSCEKEFRPLKKTQFQCSIKCRMINTKCKNCENEFEYHIQQPKIFCSRKCASHFNKSDRKIIQCKNCSEDISITINNDYTKYCNRKCKDEYQKIMFKGKNNPNFGNSHPGMFSHTDDAKKRIKDGILKSWKSPTRLKKHLAFLESHKLPDGSFDFHTVEVRDKISKANISRLQNNPECNTYANCKSGYYTSLKTNINEYYHSSWELETMIRLDNDENVKHWTKKHGYVVKYKSGEYTRRYLPDFLVETNGNLNIILEVKGYIKDKDIDSFKLKCLEALKYFKLSDIDYIVDFMYNKTMYSNLIKWFNCEKQKIYG